MLLPISAFDYFPVCASPLAACPDNSNCATLCDETHDCDDSWDEGACFGKNLLVPDCVYTGYRYVEKGHLFIVRGH